MSYFPPEASLLASLRCVLSEWRGGNEGLTQSFLFGQQSKGGKQFRHYFD
jgi:hypothetical protein